MISLLASAALVHYFNSFLDLQGRIASLLQRLCFFTSSAPQTSEALVVHDFQGCQAPCLIGGFLLVATSKANNFLPTLKFSKAYNVSLGGSDPKEPSEVIE